MVSKDSIQQELGRILASSLFGGKKQAGKFLQYIVTETLQGRGDRITQYGIAVEALGKPADYCPTESPAVRVEAGRVRKLLDEYYATEGAKSTCHIELPVGGYVPVFREADSAQLQWQRLGEKRVQSAGPKIYISCQNPAIVRHEALRSLIYNMRSGMPVVLGKLRTIQIALADPGHVTNHTLNALEYAWHQHQAEFLLQCEANLVGKHFKLRYILIHTLSREVVWSGDFTLNADKGTHVPVLDEMYIWLVNELFSLHQGVALAFWSNYWQKRGHIPQHYQVLVEHIRFLQDSLSEQNLRSFWQACERRTRHYHDDALAQLHYAIACLYVYMFQYELDHRIDLDELWQRLALTSLELNPGNAMAHAIFALNCYHRGEKELCKVEIETARKANPLDIGCGRLISVGLCALRSWEHSFSLLKEVSGLESAYPDPLRTVPCLFYFRSGKYAETANRADGFRDLGSWEHFGRLVGHCQSGDCRGCVQQISKAVDRLPTTSYLKIDDDPSLWSPKPTVKTLTPTPIPDKVTTTLMRLSPSLLQPLE